MARYLGRDLSPQDCVNCPVRHRHFGTYQKRVGELNVNYFQELQTELARDHDNACIGIAERINPFLRAVFNNRRQYDNDATFEADVIYQARQNGTLGQCEAVRRQVVDQDGTRHDVNP